MRFQIKSLIIFLTISLWCFTYSSGAVKKKTSLKKKCDKAKVDRCAAEMSILADEKYVVPKDMAEMNKLCKKLKNHETCIKDYANDCLDSTARQTITVIVYSVGRTNKAMCSNVKRKNQYLKMSACLEPELKKLYAKTQELNADVHAIQGYKPANQRLPMTCCAFYRFKERLLAAVREKCEEFVPDIANIADGYTQDTLNLVCGEYTEDSDRCDAIYDKIPKYTKKLEWATFIFPLGNILNNE